MGRTPSVFRGLYEKADETQRWIMFAFGMIALAAALFFAGLYTWTLITHPEDHEHSLNLIIVGMLIVLMLFGFALTAPEFAISLIEVLPLPPFLRRGRYHADGAGPQYGGPDRRLVDTGPPAGTPERRRDREGGGADGGE